MGAKVIKSKDFIKRYFGLTLLPHSGVSLLFTEISINVLTVIDPCLTSIIQGTLASSAVINEIIVVLLAKFAFQKTHEIPSSNKVASIRKQELNLHVSYILLFSHALSLNILDLIQRIFLSCRSVLQQSFKKH